MKNPKPCERCSKPLVLWTQKHYCVPCMAILDAAYLKKPRVAAMVALVKPTEQER